MSIENEDQVMESVFLGITTLEKQADAVKLAEGLVSADLAACVQLDGPIESFFKWNGAQEKAQEWRLWVKFPEANQVEIAEFIAKNHPYEVPEWLVFAADGGLSAYMNWVLGK